MSGENIKKNNDKQKNKDKTKLNKRQKNDEPTMFRPARLGWMKQVYRSEQARELGSFSMNYEKDINKKKNKKDES